MTRTAARLRRLGRPHARARAAAALLGCAGVALALAAAGARLAPRVAPVLGAWLAIAAVAGAAVWLARRARRAAAPGELGRLVEATTEARAGSVVSLLAPLPGGGVSADLLALADAQAVQTVERAAPVIRRVLARGTRRGVGVGAVAATAGVVMLTASAPTGGRAAAFWHPLRTLADARAPVRLAVDRTTVRRGDSVTVTIEVPAESRATLWTRHPGDLWRATRVQLDSAGRAVRRVGPLEADLFLRASSGGRRSVERRVSVGIPAFLAELQVTARYPAYLARGDEPLVPGPDTIPIPEGTVLLTGGAASVPVAAAAWRGPGAAAVRLAVREARFSGRLAPPASGTWRLDLATADGAPIEGDTPVLHLRVVPDSAPVVTVPLPAGDTTLPLSLRQPLVVDVHDDHGLTRLEIVSWRVSQTGKVAQPERTPLDLSGVGERAVVQGELDAGQRGLLPGDTLRVRVEAWDNAPAAHLGRSAEIALRLPSLDELRAVTRAATRDLTEAADSIAGSQRDLSDRTRDLAQERSREAPPPGARSQPPGSPSGTLPFQATERAQAVAREQEAVARRVAELAKAVQEVARAAEAAGIHDSAFQERLREVQEMLRRALTPELEQRLRELQEALAKLDPEATRQALQRLAEAQQDLKAELERSRELFRRAAMEGALASLAADAADLKRRQAEWNASDAPRPDSAAATRERALAERADSLVSGMEQVAADLPPAASDQAGLAAPRQAGRRAQGAMEEAAQSAQQGRAPDALAAGQEAERELERLAGALRAQRDSLAGAWRNETLAALDRALAETAALAERQQQVAEALRRGEGGARTRAQQAAVEEGAALVARQIRDAAGKHALVSPQLEAALGFARRQMSAAREQLEQGAPNTGGAAPLAEEAVDALNAAALALARSRGQVAGAQSGSGFAEAMEQLARLAREQSGLNGQARGLFPMLGLSGQAVLEQLRALAARQRALAQQLERLQATGGSAAAGPLAQEARELARQLEAGRLDPETIRRQERLYRRLLDAGRTLSGDEPDEKQDRVSRPATGDSVHLPEVLKPGATGAGPKLRYPTWQELMRLTPDERRLVLEYFRRLNAPQQ